MNLESLIENAIEKEEKIEFNDCTFYALKDNGGIVHLNLYSNEYALECIENQCKLIIPYKYKEKIELPETFNEILNHLTKENKVKTMTPTNYREMNRIKRSFEEVKRAKQLLKMGLTNKRVAEILYEEFKHDGIEGRDFRKYLFNYIAKYIDSYNSQITKEELIKGKKFIEVHPKLIEEINNLRKKGYNDKIIARRIYRMDWWWFYYALKYLGEDNLAKEVKGIGNIRDKSREYSREYYLKNKDKMKEYAKEYYQKNRERILEQKRKKKKRF